jgi:hypothetical protein
MAKTPSPEPAADPVSNLGMRPLTDLAQTAIKQVPAVKYAFGLAGIAACGAIIALILGPTKGGITLLALTFIGAILLFVFARLAVSRDPQVYAAGLVMVWAVVAFFTFFLVITTTAFVKAWPQPWADFLGISTGKEEAEVCREKVKVLWIQFNNPDLQYGDALATAESVKNCDPFQYYSVRGAIAFYTADYFGAVAEFEAAHKIKPADDVIARNLGDSYVEAGRLGDAVQAYQGMTNKNVLWNYKMARVKYYQGSLDEALSMARTVPSDLADDGNLLGRARILEAAILIEQAKRQNPAPSAAALEDAHDEFEKGVELDRSQWARIFKSTHRTKYESFKIQCETLKLYLAAWL